MKECVVDSCQSNSDPTLQNEVMFFDFPTAKDDEGFNRWVEAVGKTPDFFNNKNKFICSRHFRPEDFIQSSLLEVNGGADVKINATLSNNAIPSLYLSCEDKEPSKLPNLNVKTESELNFTPTYKVKEEKIDTEESDEGSSNSQTESENTENTVQRNVIIKEEVIITDSPENENGKADECEICIDFQKKLSSASDECVAISQKFEVHKLSHVSPSKKKYKCTECGETFLWSKEVKKHKLLKHNTFKCDMCHKRFLQVSNLKYHKQKKHNIYEAFQCESCDKAFFSSKQMLAHMKTHREIETDKCSKCKKKFPEKEDYWKHVCPYNNKPLRCDICNKGFIREKSIDKHKEKYHSDTSKSKEEIKCDVCGRCCPSRKSLRAHKLNHTKNFKCDKCGKRFAAKYYLDSHELVHKGVECFNLGHMNY